MSFFNNIISQVGEHVGSFVTERVITSLDQKVRPEVNEHVREFQDKAINNIPSTIESQLAAGEDSDDVVKRVLSNALSGRTAPLVEKLIELIKPKVDESTADLPDTITDEGLRYVRDFLDLDQGGEQQPAEEGTRSIGGDLSRGLAEKFGDLLNLDDRLVAFLSTLREKLHPLFESVKPKIWELVPSILQDGLEQLFDGGEEGAAAPQEQPAEAQPEVQERGFIGDFIKNTVQGQVVEHIPKLIPLVEGPVQGLISEIVDNLENVCNEAFGTRLKEELAEHKLI